MILNSITQHRARHIDLLLARQLAAIEREHAQNLLAHQKLENSIRRMSYQSTTNHLRKHSSPFHHIEQKQTGSIESHQIRHFNQNKRRLSTGTGSSSASSRNYLDECSDNFSTSTSSQRRRYSTKPHRLPPIATTNSQTNQRKRDNSNQHWMAQLQRIDMNKEYLPESWPIFNEELPKPIREELPPLQRQIRAFLATLPSNKETRPSFPPTALYSNRAAIAIQ